jgi:hypothetical protein
MAAIAGAKPKAQWHQCSASAESYNGEALLAVASWRTG